MAPPPTVRAAMNVSGLFRAGGTLPIAIDTVILEFRRVSDNSLVQTDTVTASQFTQSGDSLLIPIALPLQSSTEAFRLFASARGGGVEYFQVTDTITVTASATPTVVNTTPPTYVGPGNAADSVVFSLDTLIQGGDSILLTATVFQGNSPVPGVPVGFQSSDTLKVKNPRSVGLNQAYVKPPTLLFDSVTVTAVGPNSLTDTGILRFLPRAASIVMVSGDTQSIASGAVFVKPLVVQVRDGLGAPYHGKFPVGFQVISGPALSPVPALVLTDSATGQAQATLTAGITGGPVVVHATATGLANSPVIFNETVVGLPGQVASVVVTPALDTVQLVGDTARFTATCRDTGQAVVACGTLSWVSLVPAIASVNSTGLATSAGLGGITGIVVSVPAVGVADTAFFTVNTTSSIAIQPADTVVTAVGDTARLRASAVRFLGGLTPLANSAVIWQSLTPAVAVMDTGGRARTVGAGIATIRATSVANGNILGLTTVQVIQAPVSFNVTPDTAVLGVLGGVNLTGRTFDRRGFPLPPRPTAWASRNVVIATVNAAGQVTAQALGTTYVVGTDSVFTDSTRIDVTTSPPLLVQWGADSTSVGRGVSGFQIALLLSVPSPQAGIPVRIVSSDTLILKVNTPVINFFSGQTSQTASFDGRAAGRVTVVATDTTGIYAPDTMVVNVLSTLEFRTLVNPTFQTTSFSINSAEQRAILVFLSDPAPSSGLAVTFNSSTPGIATISPATATIPGGQLSVQVDLTGTGVGSTSLTPTAAGFVGKPSNVTTFLAKFNVSPTFQRVGVGQFVNFSVGVPNTMDRNTLVNLTQSNLTPVGLAQDTLTIPLNNFGASFQYRGLAPGFDTVFATRSGWTPDTGAIQITTPKVRLNSFGTLTAGSAPVSWTAFVTDSLNTSHTRFDTLTVTVTSRDPAVVQIPLPTAVIPANASQVNRSGGVSPVGGGSTYLVASAAGHTSDSVLVTVQGAKLNIPSTQVRVGARQQLPFNTFNLNVTLPFIVPQPVTVHLTHSSGAFSASVDSIIIPANTSAASFAIDGLAAGTDSIFATATGYAPDTLQVIVTPPLLRTSGLQTLPFNTSPPLGFSLFTTDNVGTQHPSLDTVTITVTSGDTNVLVLDSTVVHVLKGQTFTPTLSYTPRGVGSTRIYFSAPAPYAADSSAVVQVRPAPLTICAFCGTTVGTGQFLSYFVSIPNPAPDTVFVALSHPGTVRATVPDTVKILPFSSSVAFQWAGTAQGRDSIIATATGFVPDSAIITVSGNRLSVFSIQGTASVGDVTSTFVQTADSATFNVHPVVDTVFVTATSTDTLVLKLDSAVTKVLPSNSGVSTANIHVVGPGTARIIVSAPGYIPDTTNVLVATAPAITVSPNTTTLGTGQQQRFFNAFIPNPVAGTTKVALALSDTLAGIEDQAGVPIDTVTIPSGSTFSNSFTVFAKNQVGSIRLTATAPGFSQGTSDIIINTPQFFTSTGTTGYVGQDSTFFSITTADQTGGGQEVHDTLTVTLVSTNPAVLAVVSGTVQVPKSSSFISTYWRAIAPGTARIIVSAPGYQSDTTAVINILTPPLTLSLQPTVGVGQQYSGSVNIPFGLPSGQSLLVTLNNNNAGALTLPATVTIPQFNSSVSFTAVGNALGTAIGTASATGFVTSTPDTTVVGTPVLLVNGVNSVPLANLTTSISALTRDQAGSSRATNQDLTVTFTVDNPAIADFGGQPQTTLVVTAGSTGTSGLTLNLHSAGNVTITASAPGYTNGIRVITVQ